MKTLGQNLACQPVHWPNNFAFSLASAVTNFSFNVWLWLWLCLEFGTQKRLIENSKFGGSQRN